MPFTTRTILSRTLFAGFVLSFVGAKGCFGGDVSLGAVDNPNPFASGGAETATAGSDSRSQVASGGAAATREETSPPCHPPSKLAPCNGFSLGYNFDPASGECMPYCSVNAYFASLEECESTCAGSTGSAGSGSTGSAGANSTEAPLSVDSTGRVSSAADYGVSGYFFRFSDGAGLDGSSASGDCELAGHTESECSQVITPPLTPTHAADWSVGGLMCTSGSVARTLDVVGMPGTVDYGAIWGAGIGFHFLLSGEVAQPYDASARGVIGIAFDLDRVPNRGLRVELATPRTENQPAAWKVGPSQGPGYTSPLQAGRNVVLFQDVTPLPFYQDQRAFDPTQITSVLFHVPTTNVPDDYAFCITNLTLVLGTPPPPVIDNSGCPQSTEESTGFAYDPAGACVAAFSSLLDCSARGSSNAVPSAPAIANFPCVRRLADNALFIALQSSTGPKGWQTLPESSWDHLSPQAWAECNADEAALVSSAPVCPIIPL